MKVFCPNCGTENEGTPGSRVTCRACTASFEVPFEQGSAPPPATPAGLPSFGGQPVKPLGQTPPPPVAVQPPPNVWSGTPPGARTPQVATPYGPASFGPPPQPGGQTNGVAIASLVCGVVGCCLPFANLAAIITGVVALNQINAGGNTQKGRELAIGGIVLGAVSCFGSVLFGLLSALGK